MAKMPSSKPIKVMFWTSPRSLSTVFTKAVSNLDKCVVFQEPFHTAYLYGPDRKHNTTEQDLPCGVETYYTYKNVQRMLEADFTEQDVVFAKDSAIAITGNYEYLPKGFTHVFLIRDPIVIATKAMALQNKFTDVGNTAKTTIEDYLSGSPYTDLYKLMEHIKTVLGQSPMVIDTKDLIEDSEAVMRKFCTKVGLEFTENLLHWKPGVGDNWRVSKTKTMLNEKTGIYKKALESCCFVPSVATESSANKEVPEMLKMVISVAVEHYNKMLANETV
ncbi:uncharacterized protein [Antedon mediterranea]|uniref:uncharacterized protein n=1 Tax=Antedon mediterranea TaxID=105859 RepID=UPI003AF99D55